MVVSEAYEAIFYPTPVLKRDFSLGPDPQQGAINLGPHSRVSEQRVNHTVICVWWKAAIQIFKISGGGFFFSPVREFWENVQQFISLLRFFFKFETNLRTLIPLFRPGSVHSGSAS